MNQSIIIIVFTFFTTCLIAQQVPLNQKITVVNPEKYGRGEMKYIVQGDNLMRQGDFENAILAYDNAVAIDPFLAEAYARRALAKRRIGRTAEASADVKMAISLNSYSISLYASALGGSKLDVLAFDPEIILFEEAPYLEFLYNEVIKKKLSGDILDALADINELMVEVEDIDPILHKLRGNLYMLIGRYYDAIQDYDKAILKDTNMAEAYFNRGLAKLKTYNRSDGCADLTQAVSLGYAKGAEKAQVFCGF